MVAASIPPWLKSSIAGTSYAGGSGPFGGQTPRPPSAAPWLKQSTLGNTNPVLSESYFKEGGLSLPAMEYHTGLSTQPGMYGGYFNPSSSKLAFGQVGKDPFVGKGIPNFGQGANRGAMTGDFVNYGLPTNRSYLDPKMTQTPFDRMGAQLARTLEQLNTFWPSGVKRVNDRKNPGRTGSGYLATEDLGNPSGRGSHTEWSNITQWSREILAAVGLVEQQTGVFIPPNVVAAIMMIESQGNPRALSPAGYMGLMQVGPESSGAEIFDFSRMYEPEYNVWAGTYELSQKYLWLKNKYGEVLDGIEINWTDVAGAYFAGSFFRDVAATDKISDVGQYRSWFEGNMRDLSGASTSGDPNLSLGAPKGNLGTIFGMAEDLPPLSQDYGLTPFALGDAKAWGWYEYSRDYMPGGEYGGHIGLDFGIPIDTPLYAAVSGTITSVGGNGYEHDERYGRYAPYTGGFHITTDDGDEIIYAHMGSIDRNFKIGDRIEAGTYVGRSGILNGPHLHLEVRVPAPGKTPSGMLAVDPREYFGGGMFITGGDPTGLNGTENMIPGLPNAGANSIFAGQRTNVPFWLRG